MAEPMNKAQRLTIAAAVAPSLRAASATSMQRKVKVYDQESGQVVRHASLAEIQKGILATARIEFDVVESSRPTRLVCEVCGGIFNDRNRGVPAKRCLKCRNRRSCSECGEPASRGHSCIACYVKRVSKMSWEDVQEARSRYVAGESPRRIAKDFGVSDQVMNLIVKNKTWKDARYDPSVVRLRAGRPAKLSIAAAKSIRVRHRDGETASSLGREYGVSKTTIARVVHGRAWVS